MLFPWLYLVKKHRDVSHFPYTQIYPSAKTFESFPWYVSLQNPHLPIGKDYFLPLMNVGMDVSLEFAYN